MKHPGINRAIPGAILGFVIGELIVIGLRTLQGLPPWDPGVALILAPFTLMAGWMWGIGAFNPKLSEHGDHGHDDHAHETTALATVEEGETAIVAHEADAHHEEEEQSLSSMFFLEIWRATSLPLILLAIIFGFANIPGGFYLRVADEAAAEPTAFDNAVSFTMPFFGTIETTQLALFLAFVGWTIVSLLLVASVLAFLVYKGHEQVQVAQAIEPGPKQTTPPGFVRAIGRGAKKAARSMREDLPKALGN